MAASSLRPFTNVVTNQLALWPSSVRRDVMPGIEAVNLICVRINRVAVTMFRGARSHSLVFAVYTNVPRGVSKSFTTYSTWRMAIPLNHAHPVPLSLVPPRLILQAGVLIVSRIVRWTHCLGIAPHSFLTTSPFRTIGSLFGANGALLNRLGPEPP